MRVPVVDVPRLFHVGQRDPVMLAGRGDRPGGHQMWASHAPLAWKGQAGITGGIHELVREGGTFLDLSAAMDDPDLVSRAVDWAVSEGLAERGEVWEAHAQDYECVEPFHTSYHRTREDAAFAVDPEDRFDGDFSSLVGPGGSEVIGTVPRLLATPSLLESTGLGLDVADDATRAAVVAWAHEVISPSIEGGLDGVFWRDHGGDKGAGLPKFGVFHDRMEGWSSRDVPMDARGHEALSTPCPRPEVEYRDMVTAPTLE